MANDINEYNEGRCDILSEVIQDGGSSVCKCSHNDMPTCEARSGFEWISLEDRPDLSSVYPHARRIACWTEPQECPDNRRRFFVEKHSGTAINIIGLASFYVVWSGFCHAVVWVLQRWHREMRYVDYTLTAPTMLVVLAATYGITSVWTVINSVLLGVLLIASYFVERPADSPTAPLCSARALVFYGLIVAYGFVVSPIVYGAAQIINEDRHPEVDPDDPDVGYGSAPKFVLAFAVGTVLIFSSFVVPFGIDLLWTPLASREAIYITLSMIAKTTLHLWLGLTVIETDVTVGAGAPNEESSSMDTLGIGLGGASAIIVGFSLLSFFGRLHDDSKPGNALQSTTMIQLMAMAQ